MERIAEGDANYKDQSLALTVIGVLLLLIGIVAAFLGPVEMYCFYLFSEGGRFHYDGFGFGSFMFGNIATQIIGYYLIAMFLVPLGYGHLKTRRWARTFSLALLWFWLVLGVPLTIVFFLVLITAKELSLAVVLIVAILLGLSYLAVPGLLIRFYSSRNVRLTVAIQDPMPHWTEDLPLPILVLCCLFLFYAVVLHVPIFFNGLFPIFGILLSGLEGIFLIDVSILCLTCLIWGTLKRRNWAWWGAVTYFGLLTLSSTMTFLRFSYSDILSRMRFAPEEMQALQGLPLQGFHLVVFFGVPLLATFGITIFSRPFFRDNQAGSESPKVLKDAG